MIDLKLLRANFDTMSAAIRRKGCDIDLADILDIDDQRRESLQAVEKLRAEQNAANQHIAAEKDPTKKSEIIAAMKVVADKLKIESERLTRTEKLLEEKVMHIPNPPHASVPDGGEDDFEVVKVEGTPRNFTFKPRDHEELGRLCDLIDTERGARCSGSRFYYLKNEAVLLEFALVHYVLAKTMARGFTPMITPTIVRERAMYATGYLPAGADGVYELRGKDDEEGMYLAGTSEVPLTMYHADEIIDVEQPKFYVGFSTCYRSEAGSYGKDTKGIFRVHQFEKMEMYCFCKPEDAEAQHEIIRSIEEEIIGGLGLPYRVINIAAGDLGAPAAKKYDIEVFIPTQLKYRELTSCSNVTDYQARRANIRYRKENGTDYVATLNGTASAMTRMLVAIMENYQNEDGSIEIPAALQPYMPAGMTVIRPRQ